MKSKTVVVTIMWLLLSGFADAASIYKCTKKDKTVVFTDGQCPSEASVMTVQQETPQQVQRRLQEEKIANIKRLIANNQGAAAQEYAQKNNLTQVYREQQSDYLNQRAEAEKQQAESDKQQQLAIQQQTLNLQQQQLELQKQQLAIHKAQAEQPKQPVYIQPYSIYRGFPRTQHSYCQPPYCVPIPRSKPPVSQFPAGGMNPPPSVAPKMNPPSGVSALINLPHK